MPQPPGTPGLVINSTPVAITAGAQLSVPYPTGQGSQLSWLLIVNSSPYFLLVTQGLTLGTVPAFTAQVFPLSGTAQPVGLTAVSGVGVIVPGQDSTAYLTWSEVEPFGNWPSAVGSSAVPFAGNVITFANPDGIAAGKPTTNFLNSGTPTAAISTLGYGGLVLTTRTLSGGIGGTPNSPYRLIIEWATDQAFTSLIARREFIVAAAVPNGLNPSLYGVATLGTPHYGDWVRFRMVTPLSPGVVVVAEHRAGPLSYWGPPVFANPAADPTGLQQMGGLITPVAAAVPTGTTFNATSLYPYEGPVDIHVRWSAVGTAGQYNMRLVSVDENGGQMAELAHWADLVDFDASSEELNVYGFIVPATILQLQLSNNTGANKTVVASVTPDLSRMST